MTASCAFLHSDVAAGHSVVVEVSPDIHICGFCKQQFNNFEVFLTHKQNGCFQPTSAATAAATLAGENTSLLGFVVNKVHADMLVNLTPPLFCVPLRCRH